MVDESGGSIVAITMPMAEYLGQAYPDFPPEARASLYQRFMGWAGTAMSRRVSAGGVRSAPTLDGGWTRTRRPRLRGIDRAAERIRRMGLRGDLVDELAGCTARQDVEWACRVWAEANR